MRDVQIDERHNFVLFLFKVSTSERCWCLIFTLYTLGIVSLVLDQIEYRKFWWELLVNCDWPPIE